MSYCTLTKICTDKVTGETWREYIAKDFRLNNNNDCKHFKKRVFAKKEKTIYCKNCVHYYKCSWEYDVFDY